MSLENDVKQDEIEQAEPDTQEEATLPDESETDEPVAGEAGDDDEGESEYEIVEQSSEPSQDKDKQRKANARLAFEKREAKRKARELEQKIERMKAGELPDDVKESLKLDNKLPEQPSIEDYFSDQAMAKYDYDSARAQAAYQAAQSKWLLDVQSAQAANSVKEGQARQQYIQQQEKQLKVRKSYEDAVDELRIPDFEQSESELIKNAEGVLGSKQAAETIPYEIASVFGKNTKQAVAVVNYLGKNPGELQRILSIRDPMEQIAELTELGYTKLQVTKRKRKPKPEADESLPGAQQAGVNDMARLKKALDKGPAEFRRVKKEIEARTGKRISGYDLL